MKIENILIDLTKKFIQQWNGEDMDSIRNYFREEVVVYSPYISMIYPNNTTGKIEGREQVIAYWIELRKLYKTFKLTLESFEKIDHTVFTVSLIEGRKEKLYTTYVYNEYGKILELKFEYK